MRSASKWGLLLAVCGLATMAGCDNNGGGGSDAGPGRDTGTGGEDAGPPEDAGGGEDAGDVDAGPPPPARTIQTNGSAIVLNSTDTIAVAANRQAGSITVLRTTTGAGASATVSADLAVDGSEPWAAVIGNDDDTAFVILRRDQAVVRIDDLDGTPTIAATRGQTGSEPTGIAISPTGRWIYVANWGEGTVTVINTTTLATVRTVDLNDDLVDTGVLGTVTARAGLAHPRAIVVTNDGDTDDLDETIYVTEYFSQARTEGVPADDSAFDVGRQGYVYRITMNGEGEAAPIAIAPVDNHGIADVARTGGCFPNQLQTAAINRGRLYVTGVCASPRGPTGGGDFRAELHTALFSVDTSAGAEVTAERVLFPSRFVQRYVDAATPDDASRRIPLIATDVAFVPNTGIGYLTSYGTDAVFRFVHGMDGSFTRVGSDMPGVQHFIDLAPAGGAVDAGRLPLGIAIAHMTGTAFVLNEASRNVTVLAFNTQSAVAATNVTPMPTTGSDEAEVLNGRRFFVTGLGRWSGLGQGWNSCEACHGDGLTDNVTWFFARGPRQSTSLDGSFDSESGEQRLFNWTAIFDEVHDFELNTRGNSGGVGAIVHARPAAGSGPTAAERIIFDGTMVGAGQVGTGTPQAGLNGSTSVMMPGRSGAPGTTAGTFVNSVLTDWDEIEAYMRTIRSPRAPRTLVEADVTAGRALFDEGSCASCHGTSMWTVSRRFWTPGEGPNGAAGTLRTTSYSRPALFPASINPASNAPVGMVGTATLRFPAGATAGANDQIQCILRAVGTFPVMGDVGIVATGSSLRVREVRADMSTAAQGASGFNPPSLLGLSTGAPFFHAGNARTLEETFDVAFDAHHSAFATNFLDDSLDPTIRATQVRQLVAYLLSIDEDTAAVEPPALGFDTQLCPDAL